MSRLIDLTPAAARAKANRRAVARRWISAYVVVVAAGAAATLGTRLRTASLERQLTLTSREVASVTEERSAAREITEEIARIVDSVELQQRVVPSPTVPAILRAITDAAPASMTLTSLLIDQRAGSDPASVRAARKAGEEAKVRMSTEVQVAGIAPSDAAVVRLIQTIDRAGMFEGTSLEYSRPLIVRQREAREFRVVTAAPAWTPPPQARTEPTTK